MMDEQATPRLQRFGRLQLGRRLTGFGEVVLRVIYPPSCVACGDATAEPHGFCAGCWSGLGLIAAPVCERLGTPLPVDHGGPLLSPAAMADPPVFQRARAACRYDDAARTVISRFKFGDRTELALAMTPLMARAGRQLLDEADLILPIPLHRVRLWTRRYNQSALLAQNLARHAGKPVRLDLLKRVRRTRPQVGLTRDQRRLNLQGAFKVLPDDRPEVEGRAILLIDDVLTTGATANASARALLKAGAVRVDVLTFARVVQEGAL